MQILDVDLFIYKPRMNVKQILLVSKEAFKVILGLFQAGWQMISSLYVEKLVLGPNLFIMKIFLLAKSSVLSIDFSLASFFFK